VAGALHVFFVHCTSAAFYSKAFQVLYDDYNPEVSRGDTHREESNGLFLDRCDLDQLSNGF
jgi:hypothetical protein